MLFIAIKYYVFFWKYLLSIYVALELFGGLGFFFQFTKAAQNDMQSIPFNNWQILLVFTQ